MRPFNARRKATWCSVVQVNISHVFISHNFGDQIDDVLSRGYFEASHEMLGIEGSHCQRSFVELVGQFAVVLV